MLHFEMGPFLPFPCPVHNCWPHIQEGTCALVCIDCVCVHWLCVLRVCLKCVLLCINVYVGHICHIQVENNRLCLSGYPFSNVSFIRVLREEGMPIVAGVRPCASPAAHSQPMSLQQTSLTQHLPFTLLMAFLQAPLLFQLQRPIFHVGTGCHLSCVFLAPIWCLN